VRMRRNYDRRGVWLELARGHDVLRLWLRLRLVVGVPLWHLLHVLGISIGMSVVLGMMVLRVRIVVPGRVRLRGEMVVVLRVLLPPSLVHGTRRRAVGTWHHGRQAAMLPRQLVAGQRDQAANV
jgi:hypothetical protein